jgi:ribosomal protein L2
MRVYYRISNNSYKKNRIINTSAYATIGIVSTKNKNIANLKKAGRTR